ncbi:MAG: hypothetical protein AAF541_23430 [Pseudomonadota bacterium]
MDEAFSAYIEKSRTSLGALPQTLQEQMSGSLNSLLAKDRFEHHETIDDALVALLDRTQEEFGEDVVATFVRRLVLDLCEHQLLHVQVPQALVDLQLHSLSSCMESVQAMQDSKLRFDHFRKPLEKELSLAAGRTIFVGGAWMVERRCLAPTPLSGGVLRMLDRRPLRPLLSAVGVYRDCLVIHTLERNLRLFKPEHHETALRNIAIVLDADTSLAGIYRQSWFLDPRVVELSPKLAFLTTIPLQNGAQLNRIGPATPSMIKDATTRAPARQKAFEAGTYVPANFAYFWAREDVLAWAS